jgi:hypothetical protein
VLVGGGGVLVGVGSDVGVSVGDGSSVGVSVGRGVGVSTTSDTGVSTGARANVGVEVAAEASGKSLIRLGVLVGVGVTSVRAIGPQANIGTINIIKAPGKIINSFFITFLTFSNKIYALPVIIA